jgi:hypothetical protein
MESSSEEEYAYEATGGDVGEASSAWKDDPEYEDGEIPENSDTSESDDEEEGDTSNGRLSNNAWCSCQMCLPMETVSECTCCQEKEEFRVLAGEEPCITQTERFTSLVLDRDALRISLMLIHDTHSRGPLPDPIPNRQVYSCTILYLFASAARKRCLLSRSCHVNRAS